MIDRRPHFARTSMGGGLSWLLLLSTVVLHFACPPPARSDDSNSKRPPNLVLIIADDLGYGETGMMGNREIPTPGIDALAQTGVRCTAGYVTSSYCSPSRAGMMTGRYQSRFGYDWNPTGKKNAHPNAGLPPGQSTFVDLLSASGYQTALFGKWHLGTRAEQVPTAKGFETFYGFLHEGHYYVPGPPHEGVWTMVRDSTMPEGKRETHGRTVRGNYARMSEPKYDDDNPILDGDQVAIEADYLTDALTSRAVDYIGRNHQHPFGMVVSYNAVHSPMQAAVADFESLESIKDIQRRIFAGMLVALDRGVEKIVAEIDRHNLARDTLVVFLSDNGGPTAELTSSNAPLRAGKGSLYEGGVRIPMIWRMPGTVPAGAVEPRPVLSLDIAATMLSMAGISIPDESLDGVDVMPWIGERGESPERPIWWRMPRDGRALRWNDFKMVSAPRSNRVELYDLANDPGETRDLSKQQPERLGTMEEIWQSLNREMETTKPLN